MFGSKKKNNKKVFVGMSGGVDSSVSAALLKEQGYDVTGVFIKVWQPEFFECTWRQDRLDAMRVCAKLDIPFVTLNLEDEYKKEVVDYMIEEYKNGSTPNPDVMCNKYVKFGGFFDWAISQGADYVATGHYARVRREYSLPGQGISNIEYSKDKKNRIELNSKSVFELLAGDDKNKDQSYFLWTLTQKQLSKTLFPVGDIEKPEVRRLAKKYDLSTSIKKDSQGLCFIGKIDIKDFLKNYIEEKKGDVLNEKGEVIGFHDGAFYLTVGQRHGFKVTQIDADKTHTINRDVGPYYIISKNIKDNTIVVSQDPNKKLTGDTDYKIIHVKNINWTLGEEPDFSKKYFARIRYRQPLEECEIVNSLKFKVEREGEIEIHFTRAQKAITAGQSVVIYDKEVCLGGGIIK